MNYFDNIKELEKINENLKKKCYIIMYLNAFLTKKEITYNYYTAVRYILKEKESFPLKFKFFDDNDFNKLSYESYKYALLIHVLDIHYKIQINLK